VLLLAACTHPAEDEGRQEAVDLPIPPLPPPAPVRSLRATWNFASSGEQCVATGAAGGMSVRLVVRRNKAIQLGVSLTSDATAASTLIRFNGPAGHWQASIRRTAKRQYGTSLGSDNTALSHVLVLLNGGTFDLGPPDQLIASLALPPSETEGQVWFDCAREKMF